MYIISEVLYAEILRGPGGKIPQKREGKSVTIAGWKNPPVQLSAFSPWPSTGEDVYFTQHKTQPRVIMNLVSPPFTLPPPHFNAVVPTPLSSLRVRVLSNVQISINSRNTYTAAREAEFVSFKSPQQKARVISNVLISINSGNAY